MTNGMRWVFFDQNGTLLDPATLVPALPHTLPDPEALVLDALDQAITQATAFTMTGAYPAFPDLLRAGLRRQLERAGHPPTDALLDDAMARAAAMRPFPEAAGALDRLRAAGLRLAVTTNSATASSEASLASAGLRDRVDAVIGTDQVGAFKPDPRFYRHCLAAVGAEPAETCLVAAHWWDLLGAASVGMRTAWVSRKERFWLRSAPEPTHRGADLAEVAAALLA